ncbi:hypothetical protein [Clostridium sp. Marseille-P2415]|uniref:hypothetical protein n=1 Tax=Clostridium sp. Marseille-P2415 TaxID=1805471 RepID=UPI0009882E49|nr:hypothetical protein [Clostridium sp. Marseille-P2415]
MKKLYKFMLILFVVIISALLVSCKKEKVEYPPLLTEEEVLERLKETYGEEFEIRSKRDLLSLGTWIHAPGPYSDLADGLVYEASPESDPSFVFNVYTYRCYGNASPIPFSKSGGLQAELEYHDCYGQDILEKRFKEKAKKYGIVYTTKYGGFYDGYEFSEEARIARIKGEYEEFSKDFIDIKSYHTGIKYYIYIRDENIEEMAEKISLCVLELMEEYHYKEGMCFDSSILIQVRFKDKEGEEKSTDYVGRVLFDEYGDEAFNIKKEVLMHDLENVVEEEKNRFQNRR